MDALLQNEALIAALMGAVFGAVFGAVATHVVGSFFQNAKERKECRHAIVDELVSFAYAYLASLRELHLARSLEPGGEWGMATVITHSKMTELEGQAHGLEIRLWRAFPGTTFVGARIRAAYRKVLNRQKQTLLFFLEQKSIPPQQAEDALEWIRLQVGETVDYASSASGLELHQPTQAVFVRFGRVTPEHMEQVSIEDEPPPWEKPKKSTKPKKPAR